VTGAAPGASGGPSRSWYWVGGAIAAVGVGTAAVWVVAGLISFVHRIDDLQRVPLGGGTVTLDRPGGWTVYYEGPGAGSRASVPPLEVSVAETATGEAVPVADYGTSLTYSLGGHRGRAILTFGAPRAGSYRLQASSPVARRGRLAVGRGVGRGPFVRVALGIVVAVWSLGLGAAIVIVTALRRHGTRTRPPPPPATA
jgi:hypothetical protein